MDNRPAPCGEHSGIIERVKATENAVQKIEARFYHILVSIIMTMLATGITAAMTVYSTVNSRIDQLHKTSDSHIERSIVDDQLAVIDKLKQLGG